MKQGYPVPLVELRITDLATGEELPWDGVNVRGDTGSWALDYRLLLP